MNRRRTGKKWERTASEYLEGQGMRIAEMNFQGRQGEIDLIGYHRGYLVFVEVKYRSTDRNGYAVEAVTRRKQLRICRTADYYRYIHRINANTPVRYDVVAIQDGEVQWVQNAFPHITGNVMRIQ